MSKLLTAWVNEKTGEVHTPKGRMLWPALLEAKGNRKFPDKPPTFQATLLFPKTANLDAIKAEIERVAAEEFGTKWKTKNLRLPLKKTADNAKLAELAEAFPYMLGTSANADFKPVVFGPDAKPFSGAASDIYGGRWAVIAGGAWAYKTGSEGIGWNLNRVQLLDHDEPIGGGRVTSSEGFEAVEVAGSAGGTDAVWGDEKDPF